MPITLEELEKKIKENEIKLNEMQIDIEEKSSVFLNSVTLYLFGFLCGGFFTWLLLK